MRRAAAPRTPSAAFAVVEEVGLTAFAHKRRDLVDAETGAGGQAKGAVIMSPLVQRGNRSGQGRNPESHAPSHNWRSNVARTISCPRASCHVSADAN